MVNKAMLTMLCNVFPGEVECYVSRSAMNHLDTTGCKKTRRIYVNAYNGKFAVLFRYFTSAIYNILILLSSHRGDILFFNYNNVFSLKALDFINRFKKAQVIICCHGEMEFLSLSDPGSQVYKKVLSNLVKGYFNKERRPVPGMSFIVLGDVVLKNLRDYLNPELYARFYALDHPVLSPSLSPSIREDLSVGRKRGDGLDLGTVGILNEHKGSELYLRLIEKVSDSVKDIRFHAIGHIQCDPEPFRRKGTAIPSNPQEPLPAPLFLKKVSHLDYILYFYTSETYRLTASGALLDAIRFRKPVIALRNEYFEYFFKKFGELGYLVNSVDEMADLIKNPDALKREFDFDGIARKLSVESLQPRFDEIIAPLAR